MAEELPLPSAVGLLGGLIICFCFMFMLYGVTLTQCYVYFLNCMEDPLWMKIMVGSVWVMETMHTGFCMRLLYYFTVIGFGSFEIAGSIDWSIGPVIILENTIVGVVEGFFIRRIWILSNHSYLLTFVPAVLLLLRIGFHTAAVVFALRNETWAEFQQTPVINVTVETSNALGAACDAMIAGCMIWFLYRQQSGFSRTDGIVRWLMTYSVNSGAIMMVVSLAIAITYVCVQESLLFLGLVMIVSKLYANSLLGTLNARQLLRRQTNPAVPQRSNYELSKLGVTSQMRRIEIFRERTEVTDAVGPNNTSIPSSGSSPSLHSALKAPVLDDDRKVGSFSA